MANKTFKGMAKTISKYVTDDVKKAGVTAINRATASTKTLAAKSSSEALGVKQKDVKKRLVNFKATFKEPEGAVVGFAKALPLAAFSPRTKRVKTTRGRRTAVTINTVEGRQIVPAGSLAVFDSGKKSVFTRVSKDKVVNLTSDQLIKHLNKPEVTKSLQQKALTEFNKNFEREIARRKAKAEKD